MRKIVDAKGKNCPMPVIMTKKEIDNGENFILVEVDNELAVQNLERLANSQGFDFSFEKDNGIFKVLLTKGCEECKEILERIEGKKNLGTWSVFVSRDVIGGGSDELGANLIKMFFYTISESEDLPRSILFMNGGVKLPSENEQVIEHLRELENKGVEILTCGACLNYYKLTEKLSVGKISNMYDITNEMKEASKVITL